MFVIPELTFKLILVSWITAKRQLIHDRTASRTSWNQTYDFIVVGAGGGGCVVASRLAENPQTTVLLLEAGEAPDALWVDLHGLVPGLPNARPELQWQYYSERQQNVGLQWPDGRINEWRGKMLGGSTSHNGMVYIRGNRKDYDNWVQKYGAFGWSYDEILPYFIISENNTDPNIVEMNPSYHGIGGPIQITTPIITPLNRLLLQSYNALGFPTTDFNGPNQTGVMNLQQFTDTRGFRVSNAVAYIDPNPHPNNLHIVTRALVTRILFNNTTAIGVQFDRNDIAYTVYVRREVIICAGAFNSPQLLMLSGIGIRSHLESFGIPIIMELPVGNNLEEPLSVYTTSPVLNSSFYVSPELLSATQLYDLYFNNSGPLREFPIFTISVFFASNTQKDKSYPNIMCWLLYVMSGTKVTYECELTRVRSRGTLRLQSSSPYIAPKINPNYLVDPLDFQDAVEVARFLFFMYANSLITPYLRAPSFENYGCQSCPGKENYQCDQGLKCYVRHNMGSSLRPAGTCRMGDVNRDDVVVDPLLRVKNINQLRICDASIFPNNPNTNNAPAVTMLGEKCARIIRDCYQLG